MTTTLKNNSIKQKKTEQPIVKKKLQWIDCVKAIAIIAVVVDHSRWIAYDNHYISYASYFSVTVFVLISGYSTYLSAKNKSVSDIDTSFKNTILKLLPLIKQYMLATLLVYIYNFSFFNVGEYFNAILNFNISSPYYFVLFFLQLKLVTPLLLKLTNSINKFKMHVVIDILILISLFYIAYLCINYTFILPLHGGGPYLFGGTYLPIYYIGILLNKYDILENLSNKVKVILILPLAVLWGTWVYLMANAKLKLDLILQPYFGEGINPPSAHFIIHASIVLLLFYCVFSLLEQSKNKISLFITNCITYIGKNSLYIFLYHLLVLSIYKKDLVFITQNIWLIRLILFPSMILLPCFAVSFIKTLKSKLAILLA